MRVCGQGGRFAATTNQGYQQVTGANRTASKRRRHFSTGPCWAWEKRGMAKAGERRAEKAKQSRQPGMTVSSRGVDDSAGPGPVGSGGEGVSSKRYQSFLFLICITALGFVTYYDNYQEPHYLFWDENYHIASAQKYLNGIFCMEPHPPFGKLLIALGEKIIQPNDVSTQFVGTHYINIKDLPSGFSFAGYRFMSTLLSWLGAPLFFLILLLVTDSPVMALLLSSLYLFDNALIVHSRSAMLEGPQLFFLMAMTLVFLLLLRLKQGGKVFVGVSLLFGALFGCLMTTKVNSLIVLLFLPALYAAYWPNWRRFLLSMALFLVGFVVVYISVWQIHFSLASNINPVLERRGYFTASEEYKAILRAGSNKSLLSFPTMLRDSYYYFKQYQRGVPVLNLCKDDENGGPFFLWPIGARSINYRWEREGKDVKYLYLQANPVIWFSAFIGLCVAFALLLSRAVFPQAEPLRRPLLLFTFFGMWFAYMLSVSRVTRVIYLYHYFIPLLFSFIVFALVVQEVRQVGRWKLKEQWKIVALVFLAIAAYGSYQIYSPLTYYRPISNENLHKLAIVGLWDLRCPGCPRTNDLAFPETAQKRDYFKFTDVALDGVKAYGIYQEWGDPQIDKTVEEKPLTVGGRTYQHGLGVHAKSSMNFGLKKQYQRFQSIVALPDYLLGEGGSAAFFVHGDDKLLWQSGVIRPGETQTVDIQVNEVDVLTLRVSDGDDGINFDHGCWLEPHLLK